MKISSLVNKYMSVFLRGILEDAIQEIEIRLNTRRRNLYIGNCKLMVEPELWGSPSPFMVTSQK